MRKVGSIVGLAAMLAVGAAGMTVAAVPKAADAAVVGTLEGDRVAVQPQQDPGRDADPGAERRVRAVRIPAGRSVPTIDGTPDEGAWSLAEAVSGFVQMRPNPGDASSRRTRARVLYDDEAIYVAMRLLDDPDSVTSQLSRRDASGIFSDWAHVMIDSYHDHRTAFRFSVTPSGTKKDVLHYDNTSEDLNWDAVWEAAAAIDDEGWTAEFRIPLSQLRFSTNTAGDDGGGGGDDDELASGGLASGDASGDGSGDGPVWGINFGREIARDGEWSWWSPILPEAGGFVSESGDLVGLARLETPRRLELLPYTVARATRAPADPGNPFYEATDGVIAAGLDLKYGLTSNLTLSATVNPDFGQVEADPSVVNLSAYETFFPEKRPFFMEGSNIFRFDIGYNDGSGEGMFYSRRIGRRPQRDVDVDDGWVDAPGSTTILGAAKLSGKSSSGWTIGFLDAVTAEETARIADGAGAVSESPVEPLTNYMVTSVSRDFREGDSSVGMLLTATNRRLGGASDAFDALTSEAYALGARGHHRFAEGDWQLEGYVGGSHVRGGDDAIAGVQTAAGRYFQRPDADHVEFDPTRTSLTGAIANVGLWKIGGGSVRGGVGGHLRTPGYEVNDLGFQQQADEGWVFGNVRYEQFEPRWTFRRFSIGLNPSAAWTTGGERKWSQVGNFANFELRNFWNGGWWLGRYFSALRPDALRGGPAIRRPGGLNYDFWLNGDSRNAVNWHLEVWGGVQEESGNRNVTVSPGITVRPASWANLSLRPRLSWSRPTWQYVTDIDAGDDTHYLFSELDHRTASLTTRLNLTLSPTLSLELYGQPFVSGGDYTNFKRVADPRAPTFDDRFEPLAGDRIERDADAGAYRADLDGDGVLDAEFDDPNFNIRQMRGNAVLRWEYMPGSTLYLVWNQERTRSVAGSTAGSPFDLGRDMGRLFNRDAAFPTPVTNVLLVKVDYWFSL